MSTLVGEQNVVQRLCGLFFTFPWCEEMWASYPEVLLIDATYKTNRFRMPLVQFTGVSISTRISTSASVSLIQKMRTLMYGRFNAYPIFSALEGSSRRKLLLLITKMDMSSRVKILHPLESGSSRELRGPTQAPMSLLESPSHHRRTRLSTSITTFNVLDPQASRV